jgi:Fuc2NAc and GlcNAc transferase
MSFWWLLLAVFIVSWGLTFILIRYAITRSLLDIPNERSSHSVPIPRGGGVAIVVAFTSVLPFLTMSDLLSQSMLTGLFCSGALIAIIGFADDHGHIAARWRLLGHFISAAWMLYWIGGLAPVDLFGFSIDLGWVGVVLGLVFLVWMLNLYNFMDGIDGLASSEAICACVAMSLVYWVRGDVELISSLLALAAATMGFLLWNFPPAKVFMGDAGSGFLGIILGGLVLQAAAVSSELLWSWLIMLGVFIVDATLTLLRRLIRGDKVYEAHRTHAYQHATQYFEGHLVVTLGVVGINIFWLLPIALLVGRGNFDGVCGVVVAYAPLLLLAWKLGGGIPSK